MNNYFSDSIKNLSTFLKDLTENNNKDWFDNNQEKYEKYHKELSKNLVEILGIRLKELSPNIIAIPKVNQSIFRINRDTRFSNDKTPYKTNLALFFWEGHEKRMESSGFYLSIEHNSFMLGGGNYAFNKEGLQKFRKIVSQEKNAEELNSLIKEILDANNEYILGGKSYHTIPRGFNASGVNSEEYLKYNGLFIYIESKNIDFLINNDFIDYFFAVFSSIYPMHEWLVNNGI